MSNNVAKTYFNVIIFYNKIIWIDMISRFFWFVFLHIHSLGCKHFYVQQFHFQFMQ